MPAKALSETMEFIVIFLLMIILNKPLAPIKFGVAGGNRREVFKFVFYKRI